MKRQRPAWLGEDRRRFDHTRIHVDFIRDRRTDADHMGLYLVLAMCADTATGMTVEISQKELELLTGLSHRRVWQATKELENWDYIEVVKATGRGHHNRYALLPNPHQKPVHSELLYDLNQRVKQSTLANPSFRSIETNQEELFNFAKEEPSGADPNAEIQPLTPELIRKNVEAARRCAEQLRGSRFFPTQTDAGEAGREE